MKLCLVCNFQFEDEQELCPKDYSKLVPLGKDQLIGKLIQERYRVESVLAKGSMGVVYKAIQELIGREVAIKVLHGYLVADEESIKRFHKEAKAASRLNHPNITTLYDYGVLSSGQPYIVMDLLRGNSLAEILKERDYLPYEEAVHIFKQVCEAMQEAHQRGVIHRDIKPENIMLEYTERGVNVKVVDFGIAKFVQEQDDTIGKITKTGTVCGSPTYMSPEQCDDNQVDHRSDIYSLGVVIYETITGKVPFSGADIYNVMTMHVKDPPPRLKAVRPDLDLPPHLESVLDRALAKFPDDRYQSAMELYDSFAGLTTATAGKTTQSHMEIGGGRAGSIAVSEKEVNDVVNRALEQKRNAALRTTGEIPSSIIEQAALDPDAVSEKLRQSMQALQSRRGAGGTGDTGGGAKPRRIHVTPAMRVFGFMQQVLPAVLTIALFGVLLWVVKNEARIDKMFGTQAASVSADSKKAAVDPDDLIAHGKLEQARALLEKRKKEGKMEEGDLEALNSIYSRLAKKEAKAKHFKTAVVLLEQISGDDKEDEQTKLLLKKYRKAAGIKQ
jgi:serine/threonine protein kinase